MHNEPPKTLEEYKAERRRQRWGYFLTPIIVMGSIVISVSMLMFFGKACQERIPADAPFRTSPFFKQYQQPQKQDNGSGSSGRTGDLPSSPGEKSEGKSPAQ